MSHPPDTLSTPTEESWVLIDCDACAMQHTSACEDCVVTFLLDVAPGPVELEDGELAAIDRLAEVGLVPRLRLVPRREAG